MWRLTKPRFYIVAIKAMETFRGKGLSVSQRLKCLANDPAMQLRYLKSAFGQTLVALASAKQHFGGFLHGNLSLDTIFEDAVLANPSSLLPFNLDAAGCPLATFMPQLAVAWNFTTPKGPYFAVKSTDTFGFMLRMDQVDTMEFGSTALVRVKDDLQSLVNSICATSASFSHRAHVCQISSATTH
jgi:hypothetical protein